MKKVFLLLFCISFYQAKAATWNVTVSSNQFSPSNLNVKVGDVIHWVWQSGPHTTTSLEIPTGASSWAEAITSTNLDFDYTARVVGTYTYYCEIHGQSMSGSFTVSSVVPVTLSEMKVEARNGNPVIEWTTQTEWNVDHFSIRRSTNGKDFLEIGTVASAGNSSTEKNYSYSDTEIQPGTRYLYYALAIVDKDGSVALSPIEIFRNENASSKMILSISPNPIGEEGHLMLRFNADNNSELMVRIIDMQGKLILKTKLSAVRGINNGHIHLGDLPAGAYSVHFNLDGVTEKYKIIKN